MIRYHGGSYGSFDVTKNVRVCVISRFSIGLGLRMNVPIFLVDISKIIEELGSEYRDRIPQGGNSWYGEKGLCRSNTIHNKNSSPSLEIVVLLPVLTCILEVISNSPSFK